MAFRSKKRRIGGNLYWPMTTSSKGWAQKVAQKARDDGFKARVIKALGGYTVYISGKGGYFYIRKHGSTIYR